MKINKKLINDYIDDCKDRKRLSPHSIKAYQIDLNQFYIFIQNQEINKESLTRYINHLHQIYKPKSTKRKIASLHAFFNYLEYEEYIEYNFLNKVKYDFKMEKVLPKIISHQDLNLFFNQLYKNLELSHSSYQRNLSLRNIAIMELLMSTGMRVSEVCHLKKENVHFHDKYIKILGKGSKERIIQIENQTVLKALQQYYQSQENNDNEYFFTNRFHNRISEQSIRLMVNQIASEIPLQQHMTPHMFRHSFATMLLEEDVDIRYIQKILGHSSITTTQIYTHITSNKQREILRDKNPRNQIIA